MRLEDYNNIELIDSTVAEIAKSLNEMRCLLGDADKINARLKFALATLHIIRDKEETR